MPPGSRIEQTRPVFEGVLNILRVASAMGQDRTLHRGLATRIDAGGLAEVETLWAERVTSLGVYRPLKPVVDVAERGLLDLIRRVLSGLA